MWVSDLDKAGERPEFEGNADFAVVVYVFCREWKNLIVYPAAIIKLSPSPSPVRTSLKMPG